MLNTHVSWYKDGRCGTFSQLPLGPNDKGKRERSQKITAERSAILDEVHARCQREAEGCKGWREAKRNSYIAQTKAGGIGKCMLYVWHGRNLSSRFQVVSQVRGAGRNWLTSTKGTG